MACPTLCAAQAKGLQDEYHRATSAAAKGKSGAIKEGEDKAAPSEEEALKKQVDKLIAEKHELQVRLHGGCLQLLVTQHAWHH